MSPLQRKRSSPTTEAEDDHARSSRRPRSGGSRRKRLMQESGQTDRDRRELRAELRKLNKDICSQAQELQDPSHTSFQEIRQQSNQLFDRVVYTREAVLDSDNVHLISQRAARQVDHLVSVPRYDAGRLQQKLSQKCRLGNGLAWHSLGTEAGACFNAIATTVFLIGPLQADYTPKERRARQPRKAQVDSEDEQEEEEPEEEARSGKSKKSHVEKNLKVLSKTLSAKCRQTFAEKVQALEFDSEQEKKDAVRQMQKSSTSYNIDAVPYLLNPQSFTQTVENIFYFSYLVKKGSARISVERDGQPMVRSVSNTSKHASDKQAVLAFTMRDWRALAQAYNVQEGDLPHRRH